MTSLLIICSIIIIVLYCYIILASIKFSSSIENALAIRYTLVLGAGIKKDGRPTDILADRVLTACRLFHSGKTDILIMSGTNHKENYDETAAMKSLALANGISESAIVLDGKGYTTFRSCINTLNDHNPVNLFIVTQNFHLPRAIFIARALKMRTTGIAANHYQFSLLKKILWSIREILAIPINIFRIGVFYINHRVYPSSEI